MPSQERAAFEQGWLRRFRNFAELKDDDAGIAGWSANGLECRLRNFARLWRGRAAGGKWLDAGCGAGTYCRFLAANRMRVLGVDYSLPTLEKAERRGAAGIAWALGDVTQLPVKSGTFDGALCFGVMQALADSDRAVGELARVVRAGGEIWIDALNAWCLPHLWERLSRAVRGVPMHLRYEHPWRLRKAVRSSGLRDARIYWVPILPARLKMLQPVMEASITRWILRWIPPFGALLSHAFIIRARRGGAVTEEDR